jgi:CBS domain-containing protein
MENHGRAKAHNRRRDAANRKRRLAYMRRYRAANRKRFNALSRAHHAAHRKRRLVYMRAYYVARRERDKLNKIFKEGKAIHSVGPDTSVTECVRLMTASKIGALIVMDGKQLIGIFTERDALNKVLADGLDPDNTKVSKVMTKRPYSVRPTTTVGNAMKVITKRRFRHLPIVDHGKVLAVVSSGDLIHWLE